MIWIQFTKFSYYAFFSQGRKQKKLNKQTKKVWQKFAFFQIDITRKNVICLLNCRCVFFFFLLDEKYGTIRILFGASYHHYVVFRLYELFFLSLSASMYYCGIYFSFDMCTTSCAIHAQSRKHKQALAHLVADTAQCTLYSSPIHA